MFYSKKKGYRVERKIRLLFEKNKWKVVRAGASLGEADLICIKDGKCVLLQIKSTRKKIFYYYGYMKNKIEGFPYYLVVNFGYGKIKILEPKRSVTPNDGLNIKNFLKTIKYK